MDVARGGVRGGAPAHPRSRRMPDCDTLAENYDPAVNGRTRRMPRALPARACGARRMLRGLSADKVTCRET